MLPLPGPDVRTSLTAVENLADACLAAIGVDTSAAAVVKRIDTASTDKLKPLSRPTAPMTVA